MRNFKVIDETLYEFFCDEKKNIDYTHARTLAHIECNLLLKNFHISISFHKVPRRTQKSSNQIYILSSRILLNLFAIFYQESSFSDFPCYFPSLNIFVRFRIFIFYLKLRTSIPSKNFYVVKFHAIKSATLQVLDKFTKFTDKKNMNSCTK